MILGALGWIFSVPLEHTRQIEGPDHDHDNSSMQPELAKANLDSPGRCSIAAAILDSERSQQGWSVGHRGVLGRHTDNAVGSSTACRVLGAPCCGRQTLAYMFYPERNTTGSLTLKPDGTGVLLNGAVTLQPEWRATSDGLCMKPALLIPERCFKLLINGSSIDGIEDEKLVFRLFR